MVLKLAISSVDLQQCKLNNVLPWAGLQVHVVWNLKTSGVAGDPSGGGLEVSPLEADVPAGGSLPFRVCFFPAKRNCYFAEEAEAFASPVNQRTFRWAKGDISRVPYSCPPVIAN